VAFDDVVVEQELQSRLAAEFRQGAGGIATFDVKFDGRRAGIGGHRTRQRGGQEVDR
jgi:hypothetical protein